MSKQTLINWSKEFEAEIKKLKETELDELREKYCLLKEHKIRLFGKRLISIDRELDRRKLKDIATDKLILLLVKIYRAFPEMDERSEKFAKEGRLEQQIQEYIKEMKTIFGDIKET